MCDDGSSWRHIDRNIDTMRALHTHTHTLGIHSHSLTRMYFVVVKVVLVSANLFFIYEFIELFIYIFDRFSNHR